MRVPIVKVPIVRVQLWELIDKANSTAKAHTPCTMPAARHTLDSYALHIIYATFGKPANMQTNIQIRN